MLNSRTNNSIKNIVYSFANQGIVTILTFITRSILIFKLGEEYLGINGLFTNIMTMLSLAELGIGLAIPASLYKPLAEGDKEKINILMKLYKKIYIMIGIIVFIVGFSLTPFLNFFIKSSPNIKNIRIIYIIYVLNSAISYFCIYKATLITANQKSYILSKINNYASLILAVGQCLILLTTENYILFLLINTIVIIGKNIFISKRCDKEYPYIKDKINKTLNKKEKKEISKNILAVSIYKIGTVLLNGTDSMIISKFIGIIETGLFSNYTMVINAINSILCQISNGLVASVGNLSVTSEENKSRIVFKRLNFLNFWLYSICTICILTLINPFISVWIGKQYCFSESIVWIIVINFYISGVQAITTTFLTAYGLFWQGKYRPIIMAIINITLDLFLVNRIGILGVLLATLIARLLTIVWYDPFIIYKYGFKSSPKEYYLEYCRRFIMVIFIGILFKNICYNLNIDTWMKLIILSIVVFILSNICMILIYKNKDEFKFFMKNLKNIKFSIKK